MSGFYQTFFGPLDKTACYYFYFLSVLFFTLLIGVLIKELMFAFTHYKSLNAYTIVKGIIILLNVFFAYFVNRLMFTMCTNSVA